MHVQKEKQDPQSKCFYSGATVTLFCFFHMENKSLKTWKDYFFKIINILTHLWMCLLVIRNFLFLFLWLLCSLLSTVIYHKINNKTYKTDSVDAAISKGHDRYTMFRCHVNDNASLYFIFPQWQIEIFEIMGKILPVPLTLTQHTHQIHTYSIKHTSEITMTFAVSDKCQCDVSLWSNSYIKTFKR